MPSTGLAGPVNTEERVRAIAERAAVAPLSLRIDPARLQAMRGQGVELDCAAARSGRKRLLDVIVALALLVFLAPLLLAVAVAVRCESRGPVLFRQRRTGLGGRPFLILKFRTMSVSEDGAEVRQATRRDPRVTRVGAFLRRSSLDELPQLINVLRGEMSLVGPRPHALAHDAVFSSIDPDYLGRFATRPGMTGLAQVNGCRGEIKSPEDLLRRGALDRRYCEQWSLALDLKILIRTAATVAFHETAY